VLELDVSGGKEKSLARGGRWDSLALFEKETWHEGKKIRENLRDQRGRGALSNQESGEREEGVIGKYLTTLWKGEGGEGNRKEGGGGQRRNRGEKGKIFSWKAPAGVKA